MSENVGASTSRNPKGLHGLYRDNFTFYLIMIFWHVDPLLGKNCETSNYTTAIAK
jgi:hypothetical protein